MSLAGAIFPWGYDTNRGQMRFGSISGDVDEGVDIGTLDAEIGKITLSNLSDVDPQDIYNRYGRIGLDKLVAKISDLMQAKKDNYGFHLSSDEKAATRDKLTQITQIVKENGASIGSICWKLPLAALATLGIEALAIYFGGAYIFKALCGSPAVTTAVAGGSGAAATPQGQRLLAQARNLVDVANKIRENVWIGTTDRTRTLGFWLQEGVKRGDQAITRIVDEYARHSEYGNLKYIEGSILPRLETAVCEFKTAETTVSFLQSHVGDWQTMLPQVLLGGVALGFAIDKARSMWPFNQPAQLPMTAGSGEPQTAPVVP